MSFLFHSCAGRVLTSHRARRWCAVLSLCALTCGVSAGPAAAGDQFTLDTAAASFGAVATDSAGNAYITWLHTDGTNDVPMFCRLDPAGIILGSGPCTDETALPHLTSAPLADGTSGMALATNPNWGRDLVQPFVMLGPGQTVWVIANRNDVDDTLIWTSTDGGKTFAAPFEIPGDATPPNPDATPPSPGARESYSWTGLPAADDLVLTNGENFDAYNATTAGLSSQPPTFPLGVAEASHGAQLGFNYLLPNTSLAGPPDFSEFTFTSVGPVGTFVGSSTLGVSGFGTTAPFAPSDFVEADYSDNRLSGPADAELSFYDDCGDSDGCVSTNLPGQGQGGWQGPFSLGTGYEPRLVDGIAGMFLLSEDGTGGPGHAPDLLQIRKWSQATQSFGAPRTIATNPTAQAYVGGGFGENLDTGALAVVWPDSATGQLALYASTNRGARFLAPQDIASVSDFSENDNARVAVSSDGTGWVTFREGDQLEVANLSPDAAQYTTLFTRIFTAGSEYVEVPVTCLRTAGACPVLASLVGVSRTYRGQIGPGSSFVGIPLTARGMSLLAAGHGTAKFRLMLRFGDGEGVETQVTVRPGRG